jgi:hypothetical protein
MTLPPSTAGSAMIPGEEGMTLKSDIDRFYTEDIQMKKLLIETIKPKLK